MSHRSSILASAADAGPVEAADFDGRLEADYVPRMVRIPIWTTVTAALALFASGLIIGGDWYVIGPALAIIVYAAGAHLAD